MSDIVERLRDLGRVLEEQWLLDAAHEIERLRGLLYEVWDAAPYLGGDINRRVREALGDE
ncbi:MAG: hypothetical protein MUE59_17260 [Thiobacillaceae bacterium]|nr:hypothetical protein [Thiobacillaceae bacterium]